MGDFKLLVGNPGEYSGWYPPDKVYTEEMFVPEFTFDERLKAGNESYYKLFNLKGNIDSLGNWFRHFSHNRMNFILGWYIEITISVCLSVRLLLSICLEQKLSVEG